MGGPKSDGLGVDVGPCHSAEIRGGDRPSLRSRGDNPVQYGFVSKLFFFAEWVDWL
jgi:hypothetical protein